jgi:predicted outer membrane repeat protein
MWHEDEETGDPGGAIGTYMGSRPLSAYGPQYAQEGTVALLASPSKVSVGLALYGGVEDFIAHYETSDPAKARGNFIVWTVFGDPSLSLRTAAPTLMDVTHDGYLLPGQTEYAISVRSVAGGEPITGALGALFADGVLYGTGWTDAGGDATIVLDPVPETPMWLTLTVTARDRVTYWETNNVHPSCLVRPDGSGDYETIQDALDDAVSGWVIQLSDGEFVGGGNRELDCRGKCLTIMSQSGDPAACVIDCESSGIDAHCGIVFDRWALGGELVLKGLTITNGRRESGGGAVCCLGESGTCDLNATQCMFTGNQSDGRGGAVLCEGDANLAWCTFAWNTAEYGGGVACEGELGITKSTFFGNEAGEAGGGGIYFPSGATGTVTNTIIAFSGSGGGVVCEDEIGPSMACCDMFGNVGGDWNRCTEDLGGNFSLDPCFCDAENGDFALWNYSPCLQEGCGLVGAWDFGCSDPSRTSEGTVGAVTYGLGPIWPVPASDGFRLKYSVGADCEKLPVNVGIYDVTGRCVRTLANGTRRPGTYTLDWDGNDEAGNAVAAGVFFCRMAHGSRTMSRPVVVLKNR